MRWRGRRQSDNIEDRRGAPGGGMRSPFGRGGKGIKIGRRGAKGGGIGIGGLVVVLIVSYVLGVNPLELLSGGGSLTQETSRTPAKQSAKQNELARFVGVVLADTEDVWHAVFQRMGQRYQEPKLVLFSGAVRSACGQASSAMGPFYCPGDRKVYIDLDFYREMRQKFKAPGDFAQAYVVAHEVGHHVQTLLGISSQVQEAKRRSSKTQANALQVRMELQADCFAGLWANHADKTKQIIERGDVEEALGAARAIGDDTLQKRSRGYVVPDSFTHGSSAQRIRWFRTGLKTGRVKDCDTFSAARL